MLVVDTSARICNLVYNACFKGSVEKPESKTENICGLSGLVVVYAKWLLNVLTLKPSNEGGIRSFNSSTIALPPHITEIVIKEPE